MKHKQKAFLQTAKNLITNSFNKANKNLPKRKDVLELAKEELRILFGRN